MRLVTRGPSSLLSLVDPLLSSESLIVADTRYAMSTSTLVNGVIKGCAWGSEQPAKTVKGLKVPGMLVKAAYDVSLCSQDISKARKRAFCASFACQPPLFVVAFLPRPALLAALAYPYSYVYMVTSSLREFRGLKPQSLAKSRIASSGWRAARAHACTCIAIPYGVECRGRGAHSDGLQLALI